VFELEEVGRQYAAAQTTVEELRGALAAAKTEVEVAHSSNRRLEAAASSHAASAHDAATASSAAHARADTLHDELQAAYAASIDLT
jgi:hypothetical protein